MARLLRRKKARLERIRGPFFPKGIGQLTVIFQKTPLVYSDMMNLYRRATNCDGYGKAKSADGYEWFANLYFRTKQGHVQILFPQRNDNTSAAVYKQGGKISQDEVNSVIRAVMTALPKLPALRGKSPKDYDRI